MNQSLSRFLFFQSPIAPLWLSLHLLGQPRFLPVLDHAQMRWGRSQGEEIWLRGESNLGSIQSLFQECSALGHVMKGALTPSLRALQHPLHGLVLQEKASTTTTTPSPMTILPVSLAGVST